MSDPNLPEGCIASRGKLLGGGVSGIVELTDDGSAVKTPWPYPGDDGLECQDDLRHEARVYDRIAERVGDHAQLIKIFAFDQDQFTLTMEYMANGTLRQYLQSNAHNITQRQRHTWIRALSEGLTLVHRLAIIHCDLTPHNLLLDDKLELKIADFGCCSMNKSASGAGGNARFYPTSTSWTIPVTEHDEFFALGSCMDEILTGKVPFQDVESPQVRILARLQQFPDLVGLDFKDIVRDCWLGRAKSAKDVLFRVLQSL